MKILIATDRLRKRTGVELVTHDFAVGLARRGHSVAVAANDVGALGNQVRQAGVPVFVAGEQLSFVPDIIHFNGNDLAEQLTDQFPNAARLLHWHRVFPKHKTLDPVLYDVIVAVSKQSCIEIEQFAQRPTDGVFGNFINSDTFEPRREPLPDKPKRWLIVGQQKGGYPLIAKIAAIGLSRAVIVHGIGPRFFKRVDNLPAKTSSYDLVFASGRCALEAAMSGAGVIVADSNGVADFLSPDNLSDFRDQNLASRLLRQGNSLKILKAAIDRYDAEQAQKVSELLLRTADLNSGLQRLEDLYAKALQNVQQRSQCKYAC